MSIGSESTTSATARLLHMAVGAWVGQAIHVAAKLGIADLLESGPKTPAEIATTTGSNPEALHRLLRTLAGWACSPRMRGRFELRRWQTGCGRITVSLRAFAIMQGEEMLWRPWGELHHAVQTGEASFAHVFGSGLYDYLGKHPQGASIFDAAITDRARQENGAVVDAYDWASDMIVDVGGGQGSLLAAILYKARSARGLLFEGLTSPMQRKRSSSRLVSPSLMRGGGAAIFSKACPKAATSI